MWAWVESPLVPKGASDIFSQISFSVGDLASWIEENASKLKNLASSFESVLIPVFNGSLVNNTNNMINNEVNNTQTLLNTLGGDIASLEVPYAYLTGNLTVLETGESNRLITSGLVPSSANVPNPIQDTLPEMIAMQIALDVLKNDSAVITNQISNAIPSSSPFDNSTFDGLFQFPDFHLPFNFSDLEGGLSLAIDKILEVTGLNNPLGALNQTVTSFGPGLGLPSFANLYPYVSNGGGVYTAIVAVVAATVVIANLFFYIALLITPILARVPFCYASLIIFPLGIIIGLHLGFGAATDTFCVHHIEYLHYFSGMASQEFQNASEPFRGVMMKIFDDPEKLLYCTGNDTIFGLYNIDIWEELGFADKINALLNGTTLKFPATNATDQGVQAFRYPLRRLSDTVDFWISQNQNYSTHVGLVKNDLDQTYIRNCSTWVPPPPPTCDYCCNIVELQITANDTSDLLSRILPDLYKLKSDIDDMYNQTVKLENLRKTILQNFADSMNFPDLSMNLGKAFADSVADCSWIGDLYQNMIRTGMCMELSPGLVFVGWGYAILGLAMIFSIPLLFWTIHMDTGII